MKWLAPSSFCKESWLLQNDSPSKKHAFLQNGMVDQKNVLIKCLLLLEKCPWSGTWVKPFHNGNVHKDIFEPFWLWFFYTRNVFGFSICKIVTIMRACWDFQKHPKQQRVRTSEIAALKRTMRGAWSFVLRCAWAAAFGAPRLHCPRYSQGNYATAVPACAS